MVEISNDNLNVMQIGTVSQDYFDIVGDAVGIDWGYAYVSAIGTSYIDSLPCLHDA